MTWREFEAAAPELAVAGWESLDARRLALLGTLRMDGSPRISPVEPFLVDGRLLIGAMAWTKKAIDLQRDPRCVLHSVVVDRDAGAPEFKLYGRAELVAGADADAPGAWWLERPDEARVFSIAVESCVVVTWDLAGGRVTTRRWSRDRGPSEKTRAYP